jgi:hypothetical protein
MGTSKDYNTNINLTLLETGYALPDANTSYISIPEDIKLAESFMTLVNTMYITAKGSSLGIFSDAYWNNDTSYAKYSINLSYSSFSKFIRCPYKFFAENVINRTVDSAKSDEDELTGTPATIAGTIVHYYGEFMITQKINGVGYNLDNLKQQAISRSIFR